MSPGAPPAPLLDGVTTAPAPGRCEVIVFCQDAHTSLGRLPVSQVELILEVIGVRTQELARAGCKYVLAFENRGVEMGVTLSHPHGQLYGYGFVPGMQTRMMEAMRTHLAEEGEDFITALVRKEARLETRRVAAREHALAFVPPFARFPYETWIAPFRPAAYLADLDPLARAAVAELLSETLRRLDSLWGVPMPYLMTINQAPTDGEAHPEWSVFIEIRPIRRARDKLKYLAGTELGAGVFVSDVTPEDAAATLREVSLETGL
jgi:UDPglucose--hexose-1-phosphate uridylyltransferase